MRPSRTLVVTTVLGVLTSLLVGLAATPALADSAPALTPAVAHDLAVGDDFVCVRAADGTVACSGNNTANQVSGATAITGATQIAAFGQTACAIVGAGSVQCWGSNANGQATPPASVTTAVQVALNSLNGCALLANGHVTCWGLDNGHVVSGTSSVSGLTQISLSTYFGCGVDTSYTVHCWGTLSAQFVATPPPAVTSVALTNGDICYTTPSGTPLCYSYGSLDVSTPNMTSVENAVVGVYCGLSAGSGVVACQGSGITAFSPKSGYVEIAGGLTNVCALDAAGHAHCARPAGGAGALVPPTQVAGLQGPSAATAPVTTQGLSHAKVSFTAPTQTQPTTYVVTNGADSSAPVISCATTGTSCVLSTVPGAANFMRVTAVSSYGVAPATAPIAVNGVYDIGTYQPVAVGISGTTTLVVPGATPYTPQPVTVTGPVLVPTAAISANRDFELVDTTAAVVQAWPNVPVVTRAQQNFGVGLALCDPANLPTDTSSCATGSDQWALSWTGQSNSQDLIPGNYTVESRTHGTSDAFTPIDGPNTLTVVAPVPETLTVSNPFSGDLTYYGPNAQGQIEVQVAGHDGLVVPFSGTIDLYDSGNHLIQHWDLAETSNGVSFVALPGLAIGQYTVHVNVSNAYGSLSQDDPLSVLQDTLTGVSAYAAQPDFFPYVDGYLDTVAINVMPLTTHLGPPPDGVLNISQNGQVLRTIPVSGLSAVVNWDGRINGVTTFGTFDVQAVYTQDNTTYTSAVFQVHVDHTEFRNVTMRTWDPVVYPYHDGYIDTARFVINAPGTVTLMPLTSGTLTIKSGNTTVATVPVTSLTDYATWNGTVNGSMVAGTYTATVTLNGGDGPPATASSSVKISTARLYLKHAVTSFAPWKSQIRCTGEGKYSCKKGTALLAKKKVAAEIYTVGPHANTDGLVSINTMAFPKSAVRISRWSLHIAGRSDGPIFGMYFCDQTKPINTVNCVAAGRFKNKQQTSIKYPWLTPWSKTGLTGKSAEWLIVGAAKGSLSLVNYKLLVDYYILK